MNYRSGYAVLVGRPNVGKSTLLNRLLGQKLAITSHKPQTTRHRILGIKSREDGQIVFVDTPGIHERGNKAMSHYLNRTAHTALIDVDVAVFVVQALAWTSEDERVLNAVARAGVPTILAVNKVDLVEPKEKLLPFLQMLAERHGFVDVIPVSASRGDNADALTQAVLDRLPEGESVFPDDQITDRSERFFAAELLREQLIRRYHRELPYATTVEIERFEEEDGRYLIGAVIWVEREGQRAILLGKGGQAMKETATAARKAMNDFFQTRVHLEVWIKVKKSWSSDEAGLSRLGYTD
ncbi:MAG: GTPase Era [Gammaproteobacteria bacterium]|nr:GTPase Era [Gammaproteobacteria bacterium]MCP5316861.1 GTPase Era [Chromatiaceae bacterium]MCW5587110.1 GTPase Era [Chromatiales bacterium]MCB1816558.1 GTPase Era [Gammaproteobacteria bacterium]MCP5428860.1 GTPase Era [Chromatiaceae bacterium]